MNMGDELDTDAWVCAEGSAGTAAGAGAAGASTGAAEAAVGDLEDNADEDVRSSCERLTALAHVRKRTHVSFRRTGVRKLV